MSESDKALVLARGFFHALPEEDDYEFHDEKYITGQCDGCVPAVIVPADALSSVTAERDRLSRCLAFTEQWYAVRFERLAELGKSSGCWDAMAAIIANGTADSQEPPTYAQQLVRANHRACIAERERDQLRTEVEVLRKDQDARDWEMKAQGIESVIHLVVSKADQDVLRLHARGKRVEGKQIAAIATKDGQP